MCDVFSVQLKDQDNKDWCMEELREKPVLIIKMKDSDDADLAYNDILDLYISYRDRIEFIGIPSHKYSKKFNDFPSILKSIRFKHGIPFRILQPIKWNGKNSHPLAKLLVNKSQQPVERTKIEKYAKFLFFEDKFKRISYFSTMRDIRKDIDKFLSSA